MWLHFCEPSSLEKQTPLISGEYGLLWRANSFPTASFWIFAASGVRCEWRDEEKISQFPNCGVRFLRFLQAFAHENSDG